MAILQVFTQVQLSGELANVDNNEKSCMLHGDHIQRTSDRWPLLQMISQKTRYKAFHFPQKSIKQFVERSASVYTQQSEGNWDEKVCFLPFPYAHGRTTFQAVEILFLPSTLHKAKAWFGNFLFLVGACLSWGKKICFGINNSDS